MRVIPTELSINSIIEPFELEGTRKGHLVQLPCNEQGYPQLYQVLRALSSLILKESRVRESTIHHQSGHPLPVPHRPYCKNCLPYVQTKCLSTSYFFSSLLLALMYLITSFHKHISFLELPSQPSKLISILKKNESSIKCLCRLQVSLTHNRSQGVGEPAEGITVWMHLQVCQQQVGFQTFTPPTWSTPLLQPLSTPSQILHETSSSPSSQYS